MPTRSAAIVVGGVLAAAAPAGCSPGPSPERIYLVLGQSNAVGGADASALVDTWVAGAEACAYVARRLNCEELDAPCTLESGWGDLAPHPAVFHPSSRNRFHGVELSLGRALAARYGCEMVGVIVDATSSSSLSGDWAPDAAEGARMYPHMLADVEDLVAEAGGTIRGVIWIQGNADANSVEVASAYGAHLRGLIDRLHQDLGAPVPFVFDQLSPTAAVLQAGLVREQQAAVAASADPALIRMVPTDDLALRDGAHYESAAYVTLGERFAGALIEMDRGDP